MKSSLTCLIIILCLITSCDSSSVSGPGADHSQKDSVVATLTTEDSMDLIFQELSEDYKKFLKVNEEFDLETYKTGHFLYKDSLGTKVNIVVSDVMDWGSIFHGGDGYSVGKEGTVFIIRTHPFDEKTGDEKTGDSLVVAGPEELKMALLPFHVHMKEATISVAKLQMERSDKMLEMMQTAL